MRLCLALCCACLAACAPDDPEGAGACAAADPEALARQVPIPTSGDEGLFAVWIAEAEPDPPDVGLNTWTFDVTDAAGAPLEGAAVAVRPFMPEHGHGTVPELYDAPEASPGRYRGPPIHLFMPGLWELHVELYDAGETVADVATFRFCLEG